MAGGQPTDPRALHADLRILAEPGRGLVRDHREAGHPPWNLRIGTRPHRQDPSVHQRLEQPMPPIRVDQDGRPNPHESQTSKELTHGPLGPVAQRTACRVLSTAYVAILRSPCLEAGVFRRYSHKTREAEDVGTAYAGHVGTSC